MLSVTQRIKQVKQPYRGYLDPRAFDVRYLSGSGPEPLDLAPKNINPSVIGSAVELLTRLATGTPVKKAFSWEQMVVTDAGMDAYNEMQTLIEDMDWEIAVNYDEEEGDELVSDLLIQATCRIVSLVSAAHGQWRYDTSMPALQVDHATIEHIRTMVHRSIAFFEVYGPATEHGFIVSRRVTDSVNWGEIDFLTAEALWDFKVTAKPLTSTHTLQLLMLWIMGTWENYPQFESITRIGVFNPRLNAVYRLPVIAIPKQIVAEVARDVIGYA